MQTIKIRNLDSTEDNTVTDNSYLALSLNENDVKRESEDPNDLNPRITVKTTISQLRKAILPTIGSSPPVSENEEGGINVGIGDVILDGNGQPLTTQPPVVIKQGGKDQIKITDDGVSLKENTTVEGGLFTTSSLTTTLFQGPNTFGDPNDPNLTTNFVSTTNITGPLNLKDPMFNDTGSAPSPSSGKLYRLGDSLYFNGSKILTEGEGGKWVDGDSSGDIVYNGGKVGIGTTIPEEILHIAAPSEATNARDGVMIQSTSALAADTGLPIVFTSNVGTNPNYGVASIAGRKENATNGNCAGYLQFATGDSTGSIAEKMRISSTGNVGIGTPRPGKKLHVAGDSHHIVIEDTNAIAGKKMRGIYNNNQNLFIGRYTDDFNSFFDDMVIDPNGNVGIGTTSPANNLVIRGSSNSDSTLSNDPPFMVIENSYNNYSKDYIFGGLAFTKTGSSNVNGSLSSGVRAGIVAFYDQAHDFSNTQIDSNVGLGLYLRTSSQNTGDSSTRMTITGSGDVGIGTTIPARLLHLKNSNSAIAFETPIDSNGSAFAQIKSGRDGAAGYSSTLEFATTESTTAVSTFGSNGTGGSGFVTRMLIDSAGNVGIGTTPQEKFHVNGAVKLDDTLTPTTTTNKLYSVSSVLYWGGNRILTGAAAGAGAGSGSGSGGVAIADISGLQTALNNKLDKPTAGSEPTFVDSDINLKTNISLIQSPIKSLESIRGVNFKWKEESKKSGEDQGLIAQEVEKIIPSAVKKGEDGYLKVDYTKLVPFLLEAVKDLSKRVKELEKN